MTQEIGVKEELRTDCELIGRDSNIFNLVGLVRQHLKRQGREDPENKEYFLSKAKEVADRAMKCESYDEALNMLWDYVNIV